MRFPIRYQFMLPMVMVALASMATVAIINAHMATSQTRTRIETQLQGVVKVLSESSFPLTDAVLQQMGGLANTEFVLTDASGHRVASSLSTYNADFHANAQTAKKAHDVTLGPAVDIGAKRYLHSSVWVDRRGHFSSPTVLHILFPQDEFNAAWRTTFLPPILVGLATVVAVALVTHIVASRISRAFRQLGGEVQRLAEGDFSAVQIPEVNDETRDLAVAVNQTAERLADYEAEVRKTEQVRTVAMLGAGLAHEIRNAATGCRMAVDLHSESCGNGSEHDGSLDVAKRQLSLMESRLQRFLQLSKERVATNEQDLNFAELISELVSLVQPAARHAGISLEWKPPTDSITVHADSELLGQAVMNILLNALDAATKNRAITNRVGSVCVSLHRNNGASELLVSDSGDGPTRDIASDVFEPFVTEKSEGVGLGLAVAKRVVESCGGQISWNRENEKTNFTIRLPLAVIGDKHV